MDENIWYFSNFLHHPDDHKSVWISRRGLFDVQITIFSKNVFIIMQGGVTTLLSASRLSKVPSWSCPSISTLPLSGIHGAGLGTGLDHVVEIGLEDAPFHPSA